MAPREDAQRIGRRLKLRDLNILMTVVESGTMGKAAERLSISQPVVSKAIADIEHSVGVRLLDRSRRGVEPTVYGRALLKRGLAIFDELRQGLKDIEHLSDPTAGEVRVEASEPVAAAIVAPVIDRLSQLYPRMRFHVITGGSAPLLRELEARNVDLVVQRLSRPSSDEHNLEILFHDALVVVTGAGNPLARRRPLALTALMDEPWILLPIDHYFGALQAEVFQASGLEPPRLVVETASFTLRNELLATQRFLTVLPSFSLSLPRRRAELIALPVKLSVAPQPVGILTLKNRSLSPAAQLFIEGVRQLTKPLAANALGPRRRR